MTTQVEVGQQFGSWTVLETGIKYNDRIGLRVRCACGTEMVREKRSVISGASKSCGSCGGRSGHAGHPKAEVNIGEVYGRWTVIGFAPSKSSRQRVLVRCECGTESERFLFSLQNGRSSSCGCYRSSFMTERDVTHGFARTGQKNPLYVAHSGIKQRCYNPENKAYHRYGGRGITLWQPWHDVERFVHDVEEEIGPRPGPGFHLDRCDNSKGYQPRNLRWATPAEDVNNRDMSLRTLVCACGAGFKVAGVLTWWQCLACGEQWMVTGPKS